MLYEPKARKFGSVQVTQPAPGADTGTTMKYTTSGVRSRPVRMQPRTIEYGAHIPTVIKLLNAGHFDD